MIKNLILLLAFVITGSCGFSQGLSFGLKAGADLHKMEGVSFRDQFAFGYHAGVFAEIRLNSKWSLQPEVYFSQTNLDTGSRFSQVYQFNKIPKVTFGYINIPLLVNFKPSNVFAIQLGPQYGLIVDNNVSLLQNGQDAFKNGEFSAVAGLQVSISKLRIYGRYVIGLSDLNDIDNQDRWKSQTIHAGIAFKF